MQKCPCNPNNEYKNCCSLLHTGKKSAKDPLELMKSRYSAYAFQLADYIMDTTHKDNPHYSTNKDEWKNSILQFCNNTQFLKLEILEHSYNKSNGYVTFIAHLDQNRLDVSFKERSRFILENNKWYYVDGIVKPL